MAYEGEKIRAQIKAITRNLVELSPEEQQKLSDGMQNVPQKQMLEQIQYFENTMLPKIKEKRGEDSADYKFYAAVCNSLLWACLIHDRYDALLTRTASLQMMNEFLRERLTVAEKTLDRWNAAEDIIMNKTLGQYADVISKRAEELLKNR
ncbi:hypothetical protein [Chitinophaga ginsengisegetis]|uniref:hypothetical protein n=1 Tax=Chitinophaga ginsengisegetis TaxID=393003 RepID=UPI000DB940C2|nr:hypothetical protein [Chitinophaga ginsengisegetis]MDR6565484.1 hypothetical protein [Chitinophaga ginsengisegetis]MDR6645212.1 hypothetical protein [Chitinophaga ginsengisegetis]MDR6652196.1 hypothetical protein [Chitinophaga ginsengisegetis]